MRCSVFTHEKQVSGLCTVSVIVASPSCLFPVSGPSTHTSPPLFASMTGYFGEIASISSFRGALSPTVGNNGGLIQYFPTEIAFSAMKLLIDSRGQHSDWQLLANRTARFLQTPLHGLSQLMFCPVQFHRDRDRNDDQSQSSYPPHKPPRISPRTSCLINRAYVQNSIMRSNLSYS